MKNILLFCALCLFSVQAASATTVVEGITLGDQIVANGESLTLTGAGVRTKLFMDLYVGSLYTQGGTVDAEAIMNSDESAVIQLDIISSMITSSKMESATREGFKKATHGDTSAIGAAIEDFIGVFKEEIKVGDVFVFEGFGKSVRVLKNDKEALIVNDEKFRAALFGIWLGDAPADARLKKAMLGQK